MYEEVFRNKQRLIMANDKPYLQDVIILVTEISFVTNDNVI